jgi:hypothetical protein
VRVGMEAVFSNRGPKQPPVSGFQRKVGKVPPGREEPPSLAEKLGDLTRYLRTYLVQ